MDTMDFEKSLKTMPRRLPAIIILLMAAVMQSMAAEPLKLDTVYVDAPSDLPRRQGGEYIFVPDSLVKGVKSVIDGYSMIVDDETHPDPADLVIIAGDTVAPIIKDRNLGRYDRGLYNYVFIPKGKWMIGATASYGEFGTDDFKILNLVEDVDLNVNAFSIKPFVSYFVRSNLSVGLRFGYTRAKADLGSMNVDFDEDLSFSLSDAMYRNESYTAALTVRQYIGLSRRGRFGVFNEAELAFSSGNSDFRRMYDDHPRSTHTTYMQASLNFSPGLCVFVMDQVSFNVSFGVFGFNLRNERQITEITTQPDEDPIEPVKGNRFTSGANFRFNIFNINFGLAVHF